MTDREDKRASLVEVLGGVAVALLTFPLELLALVIIVCLVLVAGLLRPKGERVDR